MDGTRIRLLGPVDLLRDGVPEDVPGRSLRTLVAVLSLRIGEVVSRDQLVEALWPGCAPATAVNTMQRHVSSLRGLLTGVASISARPPGYVLSPVPATTAEATDVRVAERLVAKSRQSPDPVEQVVLLREVLALWRGEALGGVVDSAYLSSQVERLTRLRSEAQRSLFRARIALGEGCGSRHRSGLGGPRPGDVDPAPGRGPGRAGSGASAPTGPAAGHDRWLHGSPVRNRRAGRAPGEHPARRLVARRRHLSGVRNGWHRKDRAGGAVGLLGGGRFP